MNSYTLKMEAESCIQHRQALPDHTTWHSRRLESFLTRLWAPQLSKLQLFLLKIQLMKEVLHWKCIGFCTIPGFACRSFGNRRREYGKVMESYWHGQSEVILLGEHPVPVSCSHIDLQGLYQGFRGVSPTTNRLSHGTTKLACEDRCQRNRT